jgi:PST family polysaccharide transporter
MGAAIATVMAQLVATFFSNTFYPKTRVVFWSQLRALTLIDIFKRLTRSQRES